jgi:glycosyltransferase involved in cell wall biosynthesis
VVFAGWQSNPYAWMRQSDLFVMSSRWEGMPNVLLEAMVLGLPAVSTDCPGSARLLLDEGRAGRLVENGSEAALAEAIAGLLDDPAERIRLGRVAAERSRVYSMERMFAGYAALFDDAIDNRWPLGDGALRP